MGKRCPYLGMRQKGPHVQGSTQTVQCTAQHRDLDVKIGENDTAMKGSSNSFTDDLNGPN